MLGMGKRFESKEDPNRQSFRNDVNGVIPGYTGFVPDKHTKFGKSHWGGVSGRTGQEGQGKVRSASTNLPHPFRTPTQPQYAPTRPPAAPPARLPILPAYPPVRSARS